MRQVLLTGFLLAMIPGLTLADGPETGVVSGTVSDAQGQVLPGVTVTIQGERGSESVITDEEGVYRFALLRPGSYTVSAALEGFQTKKAVVNVIAGGKDQIDLVMRLETAETITVTSEAPMVDKFSVTAGSTVTAEVGEQAAGENRTYYGVVNMLPGVTSDAENGDIQGTRPSVNGSHFADNSVYIDGVDTTFTRFGGSRVFLPTTATTEITMEAGGSSAEYGRVIGSSTNVIVKSGTNRYHGDFAGTYEDTGWAADYKEHIELEQRQFAPLPRDQFKRTPPEKNTDSTGVELSLGGPIKRDRAWFFVSYGEIDTQDLDKTLNGDLVDTSFRFESRIAKLNFQPGSGHQIAATYIDTPAKRIYFHPPSGDQYTPTPHDLSGDLASLSWNYSVSSDLFLETKLATQESNEDKFLAVGTTDLEEAVRIKQMDPRFPGNPAGGPHWPGNNYAAYLDQDDAASWHNGWLLDNGFGLNQYPRDQANAALTWFATDNHELKFGLDWQNVGWDSNVHDPGLYSGHGFNSQSVSGYDRCGILAGDNCLWRDSNPIDLASQSNLSSSENTNTALFVRDRFTVGGHWTFNLGLRAEDQVNKNDVGRHVVDTTKIAPRLSGSYDIKGDGKMLVSLNAGRYYAQLNQQWTNQWLQETWNGYSGYDDWLWCSPTDVFVNTLIAPGALPGCTSVGYNFLLRRLRGGDMWRLADAGVIDVDIEPYYKDEVILGFEWQFRRNWALDVKGIDWELGDMIGNTAQRAPDGSFFFLSENYKDYPKILRQIGIVPESALAYFQDGVKEYQALQVQVNRRFANSWALYMNVTWSDSATTGAGAWWNNTNSDYAEDLGTVLLQAHIDDCAGNQVENGGRTVPVDCQALLGPFLGVPVSLINRLGKNGIQSATEGGAGTDRPIIAKAFGFKTWNLGDHTVTLGGTATYQDGTAWGRTESVGLGAVGNAENPDVNVFLEPNGTRRLPAHYWLNTSLAWGFPLGSSVRGELRTEVTNVTDEQEQISITGRGETRGVRRDFQRPRKIRALLSLKF